MDPGAAAPISVFSDAEKSIAGGHAINRLSGAVPRQNIDG
jgi:hypothetical protein